MLRIRQIEIVNFRSIRQEIFLLPAFTALLGKNDVGKSNLLEAIRILLEGSATSVDNEDFYDSESAIEIKAVLEGISLYLPLCDERNRSKIQDRITEGDLLTIRRIANAPRKLGGIEIRRPGSDEFEIPTGIDAAIKPILPEVTFIEALADVAEETKGTQKDTLGKLVAQVVSDISEQVQPQLNDAHREANRLLNVLPPPVPSLPSANPV
jgi:putative ATP-dependent endonuclease of OLD family